MTKWLLILSVAAHLGCSGRVDQRAVPESTTSERRDTMDFHECVAVDSLKDVGQALRNGVDVNSRGSSGETPLMAAIAVKDLAKMKLLLDNGADPELSDDFNGTALRHAVNHDFADGVRLLLSLDVDRGYHPKYPLKKIDYDFELPIHPLPEELKEVMSEDEWKDTIDEQKASMIEWGQNPTIEPMISDVQSIEVLKLFLDAGDDLKLAPSDIKRSYVGLGNGGEFESSKNEYRTYRSPRFGTRNPEPMDNLFWRDMVRLGGSAYSAREHFHDTDSLDSAVWCYDRFGTSLTPLEDGRFVQVGGEHEDFYDPDFCIYNDVVIHDGQGGFKILGYPKDVFPPTDFHTATLVGDAIFIVGCLGYVNQRETGQTPVYRLTLETWEIDSVMTSGSVPSWLHRHRATYDARRNVILVEGGNVLVTKGRDEPEIVPNEERYGLDLVSFRWKKFN